MTAPLVPCPFCGKALHLFTSGSAICPTAGCEWVGKIYAHEFQGWNSAYAWKLVRELAEALEEIAEHREDMCDCNRETAKEAFAKARAVLGKK